MSSIAVYPLDGFCLYLMPKLASPVCPPCQSDLLSSVFEDDDDEPKYVSLRQKVNRALRNIHTPKFFLPITRLRSLTLSRRSSRSTATDSLPSAESA
jgi:hypothetical protein